MTRVSDRRSTVAPVDDTPESAAQAAQFVERHPWRIGVAFVVPILLLGLAWAFSNPPGSGPDESDHLVKAMGSALFVAGGEGPGIEGLNNEIAKRNASITRTYSIPADLVPKGYDCFAFQPQVTAACQPDAPPSASRQDVTVGTALGAYPPFLYAPIGWVARLASSPESAFLLARLVVLVLSSVMLLLGASHLVRWLGRGALLGPAIALTPMAVFAMSVVSTSGIEISAGIAVASVIAVGILRPDSVLRPSTHWTLAAAGTALALSRQLGVVALAFFILVLLASVGWPRIKQLFVGRQASFLLSVAILLVATLAVAWWELTYDHPYNTGSAFSLPALSVFVASFHDLVNKSIGVFGWLDTPLPTVAFGAWTVIWVGVVGAAVLVARRSAFWALLVGSVVTLGVGYVVYAAVFYPIAAGIQGRHLLPIFSLVPVLAGAVVAEWLGRGAERAGTARLYWMLGPLIAVIQFAGVYYNGRRYAVGTDGPILFIGPAEWSPPLGWLPWILLAAVGAIAYTVVLVAIRPRTRAEVLIAEERQPERVER